MSNMNHVIILGRLGRDPESRAMPNGNAVVSVSLATSERWKDKATGESREHTEWHNVTAFGRTAEVIAEYTSKGDLLLVVGRLRTEKWTDKEGNDRYTTKVIADRVQLIPKGAHAEAEPEPEEPVARRSTRQAAGRTTKPAEPTDFDDDIPF